MGAGKITLGRLQCRRNLDTVHISRFNLCLHEKMQHATYLFADNAEITDFRLDNNRLL